MKNEKPESTEEAKAASEYPKATLIPYEEGLSRPMKLTYTRDDTVDPSLGRPMKAHWTRDDEVWPQ